MTLEQVKQLLDDVSPYLNPSVEVDAEHEQVKRFIKAYKDVTGKTVGTGTCKNCILDAYFEWKIKTDKELIFLTMERKYKLKDNSVVGFNNGHYTNANITDEVSLEMVKDNPKRAKNFVNADELLEDLGKLTDDVQKEATKEVKKSVPVAETPKPRAKKRGRKGNK